MTTSTVTADGRVRVLADGNQMPMLGLGVWQVPNRPECVNAVRWGLELGYRHLDTAQAYGNEEGVGQALRKSGVPRDEVFVATKFYPARQDPAAEAEQSLRQLGVDQVDLYIIHWPQGGATWAWPAMERARQLGYARSIGVSNFDVGELEQVIAAGSVAAVVDQVQFSPFVYRRALLEACEQRGVALEAYSPGNWAPHLQWDGQKGRGPRRAHAGAGAAALVLAARRARDLQVEAPRAARGDAADLRFHALRSGRRRARRARPDRRHCESARTQVVVRRAAHASGPVDPAGAE